MFVNKDEIDKKLREIKIKTAFKYNRELLINDEQNNKEKKESCNLNKRRAHLWEGSCLDSDVLDCPRQPLLEGDVTGGGDHVEQLGSGV